MDPMPGSFHSHWVVTPSDSFNLITEFETRSSPIMLDLHKCWRKSKWVSLFFKVAIRHSAFWSGTANDRDSVDYVL